MKRPRMTDEEYKLWLKIKENDYVRNLVENQLTELEEECQRQGIEFENIKQYWYKSDRFSMLVQNNDTPVNDLLERYEELLEKYSGGHRRTIEQKPVDDPKAIKITTTDDHVGLEPNPDNDALFQYEYNEDVYRESMNKVFQSVMKEYRTHGRFDFLLLDNLGDEEDGWGGETVRGGHDLEQNMTADEVFDVVVDTKVNQIINLAEEGVANKIILRKCINSNHSAEFGHIINKAVQKIVNNIYDEDYVQVEHLTRFMEHRFYGDHCFILTHGKDKEHMRSGLPLRLNNKTINYINEYIDFYGIDSPYIHVEKGDLHQLGYDKTKRFDYRNFMSFAPPSAWQQTNFGDAYAGYSIQVIPKNSNEISHTNYYLDYRKKR